MDGGTELYGKTASLLGSFRFAKSGTVYGSANYVSDYTGFDPTDVNLQEGYYLPIAFEARGDVTEAYMQVVGSEIGPKKMDADNVIFLGKTEEIAKKKRIRITSGRLEMTFGLSGVRFNPKD